MNQSLQELKERIQRHECTVGIIGLGYVGLPLLLRFGEVGFKILGFDLDRAKIGQLNDGLSYIQHIPSQRISDLRKAERLEATDEFGRLAEADALIICVPTPLTRQRDPDLQYVLKTADHIAKTLRAGQLISLESTTYPGTIEDVFLPRLVQSGLTIGRDFFVAFSPEREDPGNARYTTSTIPKVVGGVTPSCLELAKALYQEVVDRVIPVSSTRVAEATKVLENIYRAVNIAMVNELKLVFDRMDIDIWEVIEAAKTKPFGFQPFYPGPGLGGHCIPIDPFYLTWKAREFGIATRFIELAGEVNSAMPAYVVQKLADALNSRGKPMKGSRVLVAGVAYKRDVDDMRESPSLEIIELLIARGVKTEYSDPYFPQLPSVRRHHLELASVSLTAENLRAYDAVILATDHSSFPYELMFKHATLIVDSHNVFQRKGLIGPQIVKA